MRWVKAVQVHWPQNSALKVVVSNSRQYNHSRGPNNATFHSGIERLVTAINGVAGQPDSEFTKTFRRKAAVVPSVETHPSIWKSLQNTRGARFYWCEGKEHVMKRRRFPCLEECCEINKQSTDCKYTDRFGNIEEVKFEHDPAKKIQHRSRSSQRVQSRKKAAPSRRVGSQQGRRQGRSKKQWASCRR